MSCCINPVNLLHIFTFYMEFFTQHTCRFYDYVPHITDQQIFYRWCFKGFLPVFYWVEVRNVQVVKVSIHLFSLSLVPSRHVCHDLSNTVVTIRTTVLIMGSATFRNVLELSCASLLRGQNKSIDAVKVANTLCLNLFTFSS